jgi:hypothetical protein
LCLAESARKHRTRRANQNQKNFKHVIRSIPRSAGFCKVCLKSFLPGYPAEPRSIKIFMTGVPDRASSMAA